MKPEQMEIVRQFQIQADPQMIHPIGAGHINDTFAINCKGNKKTVCYILQRINQKVFKEPLQLMENIERVTNHVRKKLSDQGKEKIHRRVLTLVYTQNEKNCFCDENGDYWRMYDAIENTHTIDAVTKPGQARQAAFAFGSFFAGLSDLPGSALHETIPSFHDNVQRYNHFIEALEKDLHNRASKAKGEIEFILRHIFLFQGLSQKIRDGVLPIKTTHNDTKINNVMMDDLTGEGICVIDLDTVMPGTFLYDFGDLVRTAGSSVAEDEQDLSKVYLRDDYFKAILEGYLQATGAHLEQVEKESLLLGAKYMILIMAVRFLTDYLEGDCYYKIHRENHNLIRCQNQTELLKSLLSKEEQLIRQINTCCHRFGQ